jgi:hypothetical protein
MMILVATTSPAGDIDFGQDIRPILSDRCFACHGPDEENREGGLRLDKKESAFGEADSGERAVVPGKVDDSELFRRLTTDDEFERMPPEDTNKPLSKMEIELVREWIQQGADWQSHWAFEPPRRPTPAAVKNTDWPRGDLDRFVLARLEQETLAPSPEADRVTLLRRVTFDLAGLPPTLAEVDAFLADESPSAYATVVDRLLKSSRYGEHMARYWLDAARYGDTHGLHLDNYREMWPYRDWVVRSFNDNRPFDQFVVEQLAGDLLPNSTLEQQIATGFIRCHVTTSEGGSIAEEVYVRNVNDRVVTLGTVFMGATFECTRCHDHKFDPYTMKDFYSLFAYFNSLDGKPLDGNKKDHAPVARVASDEQQRKLDDFDGQIGSLEARLKAPWPAVDEAQHAWELKVLDEEGSDPGDPKEGWVTLVPSKFTSKGKATLTQLDDNSLLVSGTNPSKEVYEVTSSIAAEDWRAIRLEGLIDDSLSNGGAGRSSNSNVVLSEFEAYVAAADEPDQWKRVKLSQAWADHEQADGDFKIANAIDGKTATGWAIEGHVKREDRTAYFVSDTVFGSADALLKVVLKHESVYSQHQFGRIRLSIAQGNPIPSSIPPKILKIVRMNQEKRNDQQRAALQKHYRDQVADDVEFVNSRDKVASLRKSRTELANNVPTTLVFKELAKPKESYVLFRGEYDQRRETVGRRTPDALPAITPEQPTDRLGLAQWLVNPEHPLTARVTVNRLWQQVFGTGIVKTSEDFGSQGEPPSHRQLLDWLSVEFVESGWDVKQLMKTIVMSATYRQSPRITPELAKLDPDNRLLARGPRYRLDAEMLRDQALHVSGLLNDKMGGPGVKPPQPDGLWFAVGYTRSNTAKFVADEGSEKVHRRSLYTFVKRTAPPPQMSTFDGPSRESSCVRRERTNTPMQALMLFNDPQYIEAARGLATRTLREGGGTAESRAAYIFRLCTCRTPSEDEMKDLVDGYREDLAVYQENADAAEKLIAVGTAPPDKSLDVAELAAWTVTANLLLALDEVLNK